MAIFCTGDAKVVDLTEFQVENLEACWADIMVNGERLVFGSVYINVGKINEIEILEKVMTKILASHKKILVCLDANSRSLQWDPSCINRERSSMVRKMGERFEELSLELSMDVLNNGQLTYHSGEHATAVDITLAHGIQSTEKMKWYTIDDMLQTPHKGIIIEFGNKKEFKKEKVIDWKNFNWIQYECQSKELLSKFLNKWNVSDKESDVHSMAEEFQSGLQGLINQIAKTKVVTKHSKPWITPEVKDLIDKLHKVREKARCHRSLKNISEYKDMLEEVSIKLEEAHITHINKECEELGTMSDSQKWKAISRLLNHDNFNTVQPIKHGSQYLFEDEEILVEMEKYHVDKPTTKTSDGKENELQQRWREEARLSESDTIMDSPITIFEIEST